MGWVSISKHDIDDLMRDVHNIVVDFAALFVRCAAIEGVSSTGDMLVEEDPIEEDLPTSSDASADSLFYKALLAKARHLPAGEQGFKRVLVEFASELLAKLDIDAATNASRGKALEEAMQDLTRYVSNQSLFMNIDYLHQPVILYASCPWACHWWLCDRCVSDPREDSTRTVLLWVYKRGQKPC
jgi:hypothetical protein